MHGCNSSLLCICPCINEISVFMTIMQLLNGPVQRMRLSQEIYQFRMPEEWSFLKKFTDRVWSDFVPKITYCMRHDTQIYCRTIAGFGYITLALKLDIQHDTPGGNIYLSQIRPAFHLNPANERNGKRCSVFPTVMSTLCESIERILSWGNIYLYPVLATMPLLTHWVNNIYTPGSHVHWIYGYQIKFEYLASYTVFVVVWWEVHWVQTLHALDKL